MFYSVLSLSMLFAQALLLNYFFSHQKMLQHGTDLPVPLLCLCILFRINDEPMACGRQILRIVLRSDT
jgi:hypothetical protein